MIGSSLRPLPPFATTMIIRSKHSSTQTKRLFNQHPARLRLMKRLDSKETNNNDDIKPALQYAPTFHTPHFLPNGWSAPPLTEIPKYPFQIARTRNKPNTKHRNDGTKITTRIKHVSGDRTLFLQELQTLLPSTVAKVRVRTGGGTIEVNGNYARVIRQWLAGLGF
ncbi:hypothetical protein FisN_29Lh032 [Fistulifera solaris]|uniref:Large ribosomal subunit protein mL49 n=1 Tax=Fistulifera solaris TaxID=1519565 RepID=A0A1Z5JLN8_FISSO|nr:hypothetical protein FisN_29Lh032 [Fistulifera solaris]|eukprot:GAX14826.1 hypothetical protein FisN_29Lh032 [Fistulifera solaris]